MQPGSAGRPEGASSLAGQPPQQPQQQAPRVSSAAGPGAPGGQSRMENFRKVKTSEEAAAAAEKSVGGALPFPDLPSGVVEMKVKEGSKIRNLMGFAMGRMELEATRQIVFSGCGRAVTKTITCVEIMKRKLGGLHQVTKVRYKALVEVWENRAPQPGPVEHLTVHKNVPSICILLSKDPLDPNQVGYQPPGRPEGLWADEGAPPEETADAASAPRGVKRRQAAAPLEAEQRRPKKAQQGVQAAAAAAALALARPCCPPPGWHNCERDENPSQV